MFSRFLSSSATAYVLDKDGTLVHDGTAIPGATEFMQHIASTQIPFVILSNTGTATGSEVAQKLSSTLQVSIPTVNVITARDQMLLSMASPEATFERFLVVEDGGASCRPPREDDDVSKVCVVLFTDGNLPEYTSSVANVAQWLRGGATLWITSSDMTIVRTNACGVPTPHPGPGSVLQCIRQLTTPASEVRIRIFGKGGGPEIGPTVMTRLRMQGFDGPPRKVTMVGDRLDTDVRVGRMYGWSTCLVETGCHCEHDASHFPNDVADLIASSVQDLVNTRPSNLREVVTDLMRDMVHEAPNGRRFAEWISHRLARRTYTGLTRRIQSSPNLGKI